MRYTRQEIRTQNQRRKKEIPRIEKERSPETSSLNDMAMKKITEYKKINKTDKQKQTSKKSTKRKRRILKQEHGILKRCLNQEKWNVLQRNEEIQNKNLSATRNMMERRRQDRQKGLFIFLQRRTKPRAQRNGIYDRQDDQKRVDRIQNILYQNKRR